MRARWAWAAILALGLTGGAKAQDLSSALTGVKPSNLQFKQVDTSGALRSPISAMNSGSSSRFSLTGIFRKLAAPSPKPIIGVSNIPAQQYPNGFAPSLPINSTVPGR
jgi:hypothetical protein